MSNALKKMSAIISLLAVLAILPSAVYATSIGGIIEGSSESTSALFESPGFEAQINRINVGVNLVRINEDILYNMPVSVDSEWVDKVVAPMTSKIRRQTLNMDAVKNDAYYSTADLTNAILKRAAIAVSPLNIRLFYESSIIYKNKENGNPDFNIPDMNEFPNFDSAKSFVTFKEDAKVALIEVEAKGGNKFKNVEEATLSLLPEDLQEDIATAKDSFKEARETVLEAAAKIKALEAWLDDDANAGSPETSEKEAALDVAKIAETEAETIFDTKEEEFFELLKSASIALESNFDETKVPLAKKLEKLLDAVDNNAIGAVSMFTAASAGLLRGVGTIKDELKAMHVAQALTTLVGNQKVFIGERIARMGVGTLLALPSIGLGTYYATKQLILAGKYQDIVKMVLKGAEASAEAEAAEKEMEQAS